MPEFFHRMTFANLLMPMLTGKLIQIWCPPSNHLCFGRFVKGEGAVVIVLKPLDEAIANNDHIYSVASSLSILHLNYTHLPSLAGSWELDQLQWKFVKSACSFLECTERVYRRSIC
jgi:hypothetical protein